MEKLFEYTKEYYNSIEFQNFCEWTPITKDDKNSSYDDLPFFEISPVFKEEWKAIRTDKTKEIFEKNLLKIIENSKKESDDDK